MRITRSKAKAMPETPVDQIFDGEWIDEQIDKHVSPDLEAQPVRIKGLGQDIPDAASDISESDEDGPNPLNTSATPTIFGVSNAEQTKAMPPPAIPGGLHIINSAILANPMSEIGSLPSSPLRSSGTGKLRRLSKPNGRVYRSPNFDVNKQKKPVGRPRSGLSKSQPILEPHSESTERTSKPELSNEIEPAAKRQKVASPLRPQTRARAARIRDHQTSALESEATLDSSNSTSREHNPRQLRSRSQREPPNTSKPRKAPKQQVHRNTRSRAAVEDEPSEKPVNVSSDQADFVSSPRDEVPESPIDRSSPELGEDISQSNADAQEYAGPTSVAAEEHTDQQPESNNVDLVQQSPENVQHFNTSRNVSSKRRPTRSRTRQSVTRTKVPVEDMEAAEELFSGGAASDAASDEGSISEDTESSDSDEERELSMFFGDMSKLNHAFKAVKHLGLSQSASRPTRYKIPLIKTAKAREILRNCAKVKELIQTDNNRAKEEKMSNAINSLATRATSLVGNERWGTSDLNQDVYLHILPELTRVLQRLINHYRSRADTNEQFSYEQLKEARKVMIAILDLGQRVQKSKADFNVGFPAKKTTRNGIVPNVRDALTSVETKIRAMKQTTIQQRSMRARAGSQQQQQEEAITRSRASEDDLRKRKKNWQTLHIVRRGAALEGKIFISAQQRRHLEILPLPPSTQDANEEPSGWDTKHVDILVEALQEFAGRDVYLSIFRKHCQTGGALQSYNVSQIVRMAVWKREELKRECYERGEEVEQWVLDIPDPRVP